MTKKEKIISIFTIFSFLILLFSSIYTIEKNKPQGHVFQYEKWVFQVFGK